MKLEMVEKNLDKESIRKRFKILTSLIIGKMLIILFIILFIDNTYLLERASWLLYLVFGLWLFFDEALLQINEYYFKCLLLASLIFVLGFIIGSNYPNVSIITKGFSMSNLLILLIQWPSRRIYLMLFNREPEFDEYGRISDAFYCLLLTFTGVILPILIMDYIK